ncbi:MAG: hypothetical protein AMK71_09475 [Nitrospira bacterium SG8_35_4]|nr:MAG: hypothetical protein AMK71_09475 [Nitrospira bacterium SG8_35_4]
MIKSLGGNDMKKLILLLMIMLFSIAGIPDVHSYSLIIIPHQGSLDVSGSPATVSVDIVFHPDSGTQFGNWAFNLYYDNPELTWNSSLTTAGTIPSPLVTALLGGSFENTPGLIENFSGLLSPPNATAPNISNDITLATVVFDINTAAADGNDDVLLDKNNKIHFLLNGTPVPTSAITVVAGVDYDGDGIFDDGDGSGNAGDNRCTGGNANSCDDNYYLSSNAGQPD